MLTSRTRAAATAATCALLVCLAGGCSTGSGGEHREVALRYLESHRTLTDQHESSCYRRDIGQQDPCQYDVPDRSELEHWEATSEPGDQGRVGVTFTGAPGCERVGGDSDPHSGFYGWKRGEENCSNMDRVTVVIESTAASSTPTTPRRRSAASS